MKIWLPTDPSRRALLVALVCSVALHALLAASAYLAGSLGPKIVAKRGEPLFVDIAPDRPEERAPRGNPSRPVGPDQAPPPWRAPAPRPRVAEAPRAAEPKPKPPSQQVAKASPPPAPESPSARAQEPAPAPVPQARSPEPESPGPQPQKAEPARPEGTATASRSEPPSDSAGQALARTRSGLDLPAAMLRRPGGGGGLQDGRGGVEGEPVPLDTPDPKYQDYFQEVRQKIKANWGYPREAAERNIGGDLLIVFHITKDGHVSFLELKRPSGVTVLDDYAMNAVRLAQPFPPVPDNLLAKFALPIALTFVYRVVDASSLINQIIR